jgi:NDP-sugar pyrophosphorylase family protein
MAVAAIMITVSNTKYLILKQVTIMATEATRQQSVHYGCIVQDRDTSEVTHYVEKPSTFVSTLINCGVYICSTEIFQTFSAVFNTRQQEYYKLVKISKSCEVGKAD